MRIIDFTNELTSLVGSSFTRKGPPPYSDFSERYQCGRRLSNFRSWGNLQHDRALWADIRSTQAFQSLPAELRELCEPFVRHLITHSTHHINCATEPNGVPKCDRGCDQSEGTRLVLVRTACMDFKVWCHVLTATYEPMQIFCGPRITRGEGGNMDRRLFLTATAASRDRRRRQSGRGHSATHERDRCATPCNWRSALPLGPLPGSRYPDPHIEVIDKHGSRAAQAPAGSSGSPPASAGRKVRPISAPAAI